MLGPWKKTYDKPRECIKKQRYHFLTKVRTVKAMVYPVVMYGCESWAIKNAEPQRIDAFELWCWRRLLRVLWAARSSNQSILKEINSEYSLKGLVLKLKLQYFGHLMQRAYSLEKTALLEKIKGKEEKEATGWASWMTSLTQWTWIWANSGRWWGQRSLACCSLWCHRVRHDLVTEQQLESVNYQIKKQPQSSIFQVPNGPWSCLSQSSCG